MSKTLLAFQSAVAAAVAVRTNQYLLTVAKLDPLISILLAGVASIVVAQIVDGLFVMLPKRSRRIRRLLDPRAKFEGTWIITDEVLSRPYSYATIEYNPTASTYTYYGTAFDLEGQPRATWKSSELIFEHALNEIRFFADSQLADSEGEMLKSWGCINFEKESFGDNFTRGKGFFVDFGTKFLKSHFYLDRLSKADVERFIKKKKVRSHDEMAELIRAYHNARRVPYSGLQVGRDLVGVGAPNPGPQADS